MNQIVNLDDIDGTEEIKTFLGRWIPKKYRNIECKHDVKSGYQEQNYTFSFGRVEVTSGDKGWGIIHKVRGFSPISEYDLEKLFEPNIKQTYLDCKQAFVEALARWGKIFPELRDINIDDYSMFQRRSGFFFNVDTDKLSGDLEKKYEKAEVIASKIQHRIATDIRRKYSHVKEEADYHSRLPPGIEFKFHIHDHTDIICKRVTDPNPTNMLYLYVISDEHADPQYHDQTIQFCNGMIAKHSEKLKDINSLPYRPSMPYDGTIWEIDLSDAKGFKAMITSKL